MKISNLWYCEVEFVSSNKRNIYFINEKDANLFYKYIEGLDKNKKNEFIKSEYDGMLINLRNVETATRPKEYLGDQ